MADANRALVGRILLLSAVLLAALALAAWAGLLPLDPATRGLFTAAFGAAAAADALIAIFLVTRS